VIRLEVASALEGERVDRVVAMLADVSRAQAAELVDAGAVMLDSRPVTTRSTRVRGGQVLAIDWEPDEAGDGPRADPQVAYGVVHVDDDVIVVDKPAGLVVHPGSGVSEGTLVSGLLARFPELAGVGQPGRPGIVHRLDRGTSGLIVVARAPAAYEWLVGLLEKHEVERTYEALVGGTVEAAAGMIDAPLGRSSHDPTRRAVRRDGKPARTRYRVEERFDAPVEATLVTCQLETGRTHQVRAHFQAVGHPVLGDERYGGRVPPGTALSRPFLHAAALAFTNPRSGVTLSFTSALAEDLQVVLDAFRSASSND
jgi:23S rRNA pseudouridine1911/1915/1917 synthase